MRAARRASSIMVGQKLRLLGQVGVQALDGDGAREARSTEQAAEVHARHAPGGDLAVDGVSADDLSRLGYPHDSRIVAWVPGSGPRELSSGVFLHHLAWGSTMVGWCQGWAHRVGARHGSSLLVLLGAELPAAAQTAESPGSQGNPEARRAAIYAEAAAAASAGRWAEARDRLRTVLAIRSSPEGSVLARTGRGAARRGGERVGRLRQGAGGREGGGRGRRRGGGRRGHPIDRAARASRARRGDGGGQHHRGDDDPG